MINHYKLFDEIEKRIDSQNIELDTTNIQTELLIMILEELRK